MSMFPSKRSAGRHLRRSRDDIWHVADRLVERAEAYRIGESRDASIRAVKSLQSMPDASVAPETDDESRLRDFCLHSREANELDTLGSICDGLLRALEGSLRAEDLARRLETAASHLRDGSAPERT